MNKLKLQLYRNCPVLVRKSIKKMLSEYKKEISMMIFGNKEQKETTMLESILPYVLTDDFFDFIYNKCKFRFNFNNYFPIELVENKEFLDLVIKYDPSQAFFVPNKDMLTQEHLAIVEKYLIDNPRVRISSHNISKSFSKSEIIFNRVFEYYFGKNSYYSDNSFYEFLDFYCDVPEFYRKIIKKHSEGNYKVDTYTTCAGHNFLFVDEILEYILERNYKEIKYVPLNKREKAFEIIAKMIKENKIFINFYLHDYRYDGWKDIISSSQSILDAVFESDDISKYFDYISYTDISLYDEQKIQKLFKANEEHEKSIFPRNAYRSPLLLSVFLHNPDSKIFTYYNFDSIKPEAFDKSNIDYLLEHIDEFKNFIESIVFRTSRENVYFSTRLIECYKKQLLSLKFNDGDYLEKGISFKRYFKSLVSIPEECENAFFEILDIFKNSGTLNYDSFNYSLWLNEDFINKINDKGYLDLIVDDLFNNVNTTHYISSFHNVNSCSLLVKKYLEKCIALIKNSNNPKELSLEAIYYVSNFNAEKSYSEDTIDSLIEYIDLLFEKNIFYKDKVPPFIWNSSKFLKIFLEKDYLQLRNFNYETFNDPSITNLLFRKVNYKEFFSKENISHRLEKVYDEIVIETVEEFNDFFSKLNLDYNISFALILIKKYKASGLNDENLNSLANYYLDRVKEDLAKKYGNKNYSDILIDKILSDSRNVFTLEFIESSHHLIVASNFVDILDENQKNLVKGDYKFLYENVNKKHVNEIIKNLIDNYNFNSYSAFDLAMKMYVSIGYTRCRDLLNKNLEKSYGLISRDNLEKLFSKISLNDVILQKQGNGYIPIENKVLVNLLFGANYKDKTTPIAIFLSDYASLKERRDTKFEEIENNSELTKEEKDALIEEVSAEYVDSSNQINDFINNFSTIFNEWDILEEEFYKEKNKTKLSIKFNVAYCNSVIKKINSRRKKPPLEIRDEPLLHSDVFDYVGYDNQFVTEPSKAPARAIELSRRMENVEKKKFPNIHLENNGYSLFVYGPQDRNILSAGFRSRCCFRPRGNADNSGDDNSLLNYCVSTEYGGGVEIRDPKGETVIFSPLLRNGNTLMIHSIETKKEEVEYRKEKDIVHQLLVKFSEEVISESYKEGDEIDFVFITDLHNLNTEYTKSMVPVDFKFPIYDGEGKFNGMYTNLSSNHMILANKEGKTVEDIRYGAVDYSYTYPNVRYDNFPPLQFTQEEMNVIETLLKLENEITKKSNERFEAKKNNDSDNIYNLLLEIKALKKEYLKLYKSILDSRKFVNIFDQYKKATSLIDNINEKLGIEVDYTISEAYYGLDWYVVITPENRIIANCLPEGASVLKKTLKDIKELRPQLVNDQETENIVQGFRI